MISKHQKAQAAFKGHGSKSMRKTFLFSKTNSKTASCIVMPLL